MSEFVDHLSEVFASFGPVHARRMFGGHGLYHDGLMFGLIAGNALYLKTDAQTQQAFEARGLEPFVYVKDGRPMTMSYRLAPEEIYDDPDVAREWAERAWSAAVRAKAAKPVPKNKKTKVAARKPGRS